MSRFPHLYRCPTDPSLASLTPVWPFKVLEAVKYRINSAIPQGAWLEDRPDLVLDMRTHALEMVLSDGIHIDLQKILIEERNIPADSVLGLTSEQLLQGYLRRFKSKKEKPAEAPTVAEVKGRKRDAEVQTCEEPMEGPHPSLIFPFIDEMIQHLVNVQKLVLQNNK